MPILFLEKNAQMDLHNSSKIYSTLGVLSGIIIMPITDVARGFVLCIERGDSPFRADKSHIHHRFFHWPISFSNPLYGYKKTGFQNLMKSRPFMIN